MHDRLNPEIVGLCVPGAMRAVTNAMRKFHDDRPERFHAQRPLMTKCPFGDKVTGEREPTDAELRQRLRERHLNPTAKLPIVESCPHLPKQ